MHLTGTKVLKEGQGGDEDVFSKLLIFFLNGFLASPGAA